MKFGPASKVKKIHTQGPPENNTRKKSTHTALLKTTWKKSTHKALLKTTRKKSTDMAFWDTRPYKQNLKDKYIKHKGKCPHTVKCKHDSVNLLITNVWINWNIMHGIIFWRWTIVCRLHTSYNPFLSTVIFSHSYFGVNIHFGFVVFHLWVNG